VKVIAGSGEEEKKCEEWMGCSFPQNLTKSFMSTGRIGLISASYKVGKIVNQFNCHHNHPYSWSMFIAKDMLFRFSGSRVDVFHHMQVSSNCTSRMESCKARFLCTLRKG